MKKIRFLVILLLVGLTGAFARIYDEGLLAIYAKIVPKLMALDHTPRRGRPHLVILHEPADVKTARKLAAMIGNDPSSTHRSSLKVEVDTYAKNICERKEVAALFLLPTDGKTLSKALVCAKKRHILTFAYDPAMLRYGADLSVYPGERIYPYANLDALKRHGIRLDPFLLNIAKIYREKIR